MPAPLGNNNGHRINTWPLEHDEALKEHFAEGMSGTQNAAALNTRFRSRYTRNAVIGRLNRMGIKSANPHPKSRKVAKPTAPKPWVEAGITERHYRRLSAARRQGIGKTLPWQPAPPLISCDEIVSRNLALVELEPGDCRWPSGYRAPFTFCGLLRLGGSSYCPSHDHLASKAGGTA